MADLFPALLPCPFCGNDDPRVAETPLRDNYRFVVRCDMCGAQSAARGNPGVVGEDWNVRYVGGHRVLFRREKPGVLAPTGVWVVEHAGYLYGPCERWQDVERIVREEWQHERNLVG